MDYPKFIVLNQKEKSFCIQSVNLPVFKVFKFGTSLWLFILPLPVYLLYLFPTTYGENLS